MAGTGGFLDYDLLYQAGDGVDQGLSGLLELGGFHAGANLLSSLLLQRPDRAARGHPTRHRRSAATCRSRASPCRLGDRIADGRRASPRRCASAGVQYATNFGTDPAFVTFPLPTIGGLARQDSVVDVFIDNVQREARSVPPGPFTLESLPAVTGAGEVQLRVTDLLGREQLVTQSYYVSSRLLKQGLHDFGYQLGACAATMAARASTTARRWPAARTATASPTGSPSRPTASCSTTSRAAVTRRLLSARPTGVWSAAARASVAATTAPGVLGQFAYEYDGRSFSFGARTRYTSDGYREAGGDEDAARIDQLSLGLDFGDYGPFRHAARCIATAATPRMPPRCPPPTACRSVRAR